MLEAWSLDAAAFDGELGREKVGNVLQRSTENIVERKPEISLPEDEWFVETAKSAINKLLGASGSETSDIDEDHIILDEEVVSDSDTVSSLSSMESTESFASARASMAELESPSSLSDAES
ncbi:hypothetical protein QN277_009414 [Acacia crassicarpa]|uniref:Uncharacterized protein n=1 Tax=Acacia crassicarpa TaxID=499986 RepID=A0AAE1M6U0_9FABA|nr:hypothetical protein QN277_009414 [Acacia crassicarpa]